MLKFNANREYGFGRRIEIRGMDRESRTFINTVICTQCSDGEAAYVHPMMSIEQDSAQSLMDALWDVGLRPSEGSGSAGSLAATERHLKDMQKMAFHVMGIKDKETP